MAWHICRYWQCVENYGGQCFGSGCSLNPMPAPHEPDAHYLYDDSVPFVEDDENDEIIQED